MNKLKIMTATMVLFASIASAQITKGNWMVGGVGSFSTYEFKDNDTQSITKGIEFQIQPNIGYFFFDQFAAGLTLPLNYNKIDGGTTNISYGGKPFVRYYFLKSEKKVNFLTEANFGFNFSKANNLDSSFGIDYELKIGTAIFLNSSIAFEILTSYFKNNLTGFDGTEFGLQLGFQIHLEK
jgi:hypothetical protein